MEQSLFDNFCLGTIKTTSTFNRENTTEEPAFPVDIKVIYVTFIDGKISRESARARARDGDIDILDFVIVASDYGTSW